MIRQIFAIFGQKRRSLRFLAETAAIKLKKKKAKKKRLDTIIGQEPKKSEKCMKPLYFRKRRRTPIDSNASFLGLAPSPYETSTVCLSVRQSVSDKSSQTSHH